ncbi:hypothetical protein SCLCIDRAFT_1218030 [Scleroderma citrinum Foug A]|uniref:Uncharacterized protein n=1 Tax=Scleroderma citrinum Foug A TaxID=1036808 RepID=A0A0C3DSP7_9AGAM|nr:hypothetical protein SCLCIDRAFT_1218030 [Scleroderma citrinum Foug A]
MGPLLRIRLSFCCDLYMGKRTCKRYLIFRFYSLRISSSHPVPQDPYNPLHASDSHDSGRFPSLLVPIRLPIFAIVIWLIDILVRGLSITGSVGQKLSNSSEKVEEGAGIGMNGITSNGTRQEH